MEERTRYGVDEYLEGDVTVSPQELVWGYVREAPSPAPPHQDAVFRFAVAWDDHVREWALGRVIIAPMDCVLDRERGLIVQPDLLFIGAARADIIADRVWGAPDLVLEVLSPKPRIGTLDERLDWYAAYGVRECWLYHQFDRQLEVLNFAHHETVRHARFGFHDRIVSRVFPEMDESCASIVTAY